MRGWLVASIPIGLALVASGREGPRPRVPGQHPPAVAASAELTAAIDGALERRWAEEGLSPAAPLDDLGFARRLWLDLLGTIPSLEELRALEARPAEGRRAWLIERALADERFPAALAERLARIAVGANAKPDDLLYRRRRLVAWLSEQVARRRPWDELVRELLTAQGLSTDTPAVNFTVSQDRDPAKLAARTARAFLGVRIDCAQCHDHFFADWKQTQFEGLAAFFAGLDGDSPLVRQRPDADYLLEVVGEPPPGADLVEAPAPALEPGGAEPGMMAAAPRRMRRIPPVAPIAPELLPADGPRRERLARWVTHPDNPYFARAIVNRLWSWLLGQGFCEPVDELDVSPIAEPALLDLLARDLTSHGWSLERLIRAIVSSRAYGLESRAPEGSDPARLRALWACAPLKPLRARELGSALLQATSLWTYDRGRAQLVRLAWFGNLNDFVRRHAEDPDAEAPAPETILQRLHLMNGREFHERTKPDDVFAPVRRLPMLLADEDAAVETAFLMALTRRPSPAEAARFGARLREAAPGEPRAAVMSDLCWLLVNTTEFAWNH